MPPMIADLLQAAFKNAFDVLKILDTRDWILTFIALAATWIVHTRQRRMALPPGPPSLPIIGNVLQLPREKEWLVYNEWAKIYGM